MLMYVYLMHSLAHRSQDLFKDLEKTSIRYCMDRCDWLVITFRRGLIGITIKSEVV